MPICGACGGSGSVLSCDPVEVARGIDEPCYHCGTTGKVSEEQAKRYRLVSVAGQLAEQEVEAWRASCNLNPDGEGWAFRAAENMMAERDYTLAVIMETQDRIEIWLDCLTEEAQDFMLQIDDSNSWHALCFQAERDAKRYIGNDWRSPEDPIRYETGDDIPF